MEARGKRALLLRVGRQFLSVDDGGAPCLLSHVTEGPGGPGSGDGCRFWLAEGAPDEDRVHGGVDSVDGRVDSVDGRVSVLTTTQLKAARNGHVFYLCASRDFRAPPYACGVSFQTDRQRAASGACCTWLLRRVPGGKFRMESLRFRGRCLANQGGRLGLQGEAGARRGDGRPGIRARYPVVPCLKERVRLLFLENGSHLLSKDEVS